MVKFNVTIASPSPLIALGSLIFNGTSIWVNSVGVNQSVPYTVYLDSDEFGAVHTPSNDLLYHAGNLDLNDQHTVTVRPARLLESVIVETDPGDNYAITISLHDGQRFEQDGFVTTGQWSTDSCLGEGRIAGTCYVSEGTGSSISYTFLGDAITLWGAVEDHDSLYQVSMDGVRPISFAASNVTTPRPITVLAHYSNLGLDYHTIKLTSKPSDGRSRVEVDYAQVYTKFVPGHGGSYTAVGPSIASSTPLIGDSQAAGHNLSRSAIIGIVVGTLLGVLALIGLLFIIKRRQKNKAAVAARRRSAALAAAAVAGVRVDFSARRSRDFDEATLASSKFSVKEGLELSVIESQTETRRSEEAAKGR